MGLIWKGSGNLLFNNVLIWLQTLSQIIIVISTVNMTDRCLALMEVACWHLPRQLAKNTNTETLLFFFTLAAHIVQFCFHLTRICKYTKLARSWFKCACMHWITTNIPCVLFVFGEAIWSFFERFSFLYFVHLFENGRLSCLKYFRSLCWTFEVVQV